MAFPSTASDQRVPALMAAGEFLVHGGSRIDKFVARLPDYGFEPIVICARDTVTPDAQRLFESLYPPTLDVRRARSSGWSYFSERFHDRSPGDRHYRLLKVLSFPERCLYVPDHMVRWIPDAIRIAARLVAAQQIPVVFTSSPLESTHLLGLALKRRFGLRWVADFRDLWTTRTLTYRPATWLHDRWIRRLERTIMTTADHIIANTDENMTYYRRAFGLDPCRVTVIPNGFDREDVPAGVESGPAGVFRIAYMGNLSKQGLPWRLFLAALRRLADEVGDRALRFVHCGFSSREVDSHLRLLGLEGLTISHGLIPHLEAMRIAASAHLRIVLLGDNDHTKAQVPAKFYNYLIMPGPMLAIAPEQGAVARILADTRMGEVVSPLCSPEQIANVLRRYYHEWIRGELRVQPNRECVDRYDRRRHVAQLADIMRPQGRELSRLEAGSGVRAASDQRGTGGRMGSLEEVSS